ncbi:hypothetical protein LTR95_002003 [Oleoguttula sp. CCFEE 5521]
MACPPGTPQFDDLEVMYTGPFLLPNTVFFEVGYVQHGDATYNLLFRPGFMVKKIGAHFYWHMAVPVLGIERQHHEVKHKVYYDDIQPSYAKEQIPRGSILSTWKVSLNPPQRDQNVWSETIHLNNLLDAYYRATSVPRIDVLNMCNTPIPKHLYASVYKRLAHSNRTYLMETDSGETGWGILRRERNGDGFSGTTFMRIVVGRACRVPQRADTGTMMEAGEKAARRRLGTPRRRQRAVSL